MEATNTCFINAPVSRNSFISSFRKFCDLESHRCLWAMMMEHLILFKKVILKQWKKFKDDKCCVIIIKVKISKCNKKNTND